MQRPAAAILFPFLKLVLTVWWSQKRVGKMHVACLLKPGLSLFALGELVRILEDFDGDSDGTWKHDSRTVLNIERADP